MYMIVLDHAGRRTHHVVEASEEGDVREAHQLGIVDSKTANANIKPSSSCYSFAPPEGIHDIDNNCGRFPVPIVLSCRVLRFSVWQVASLTVLSHHLWWSL